MHNCLPERAREFCLDRESVREVNPRCAIVCVSAFGSDGPDASRPAYDLIGQALSGLLLADPRPGDTVPRRTGGLALADFTAGLLAALSVTAALLGRDESAPEVEVSLLGAALALQAQRLVEVEASDRADGRPARLRRAGAARGGDGPGGGIEALDPYYRAHACADGFIALACLNSFQRLRVCELLDLRDPFVDNPQAPPADPEERARRGRTCRRSRPASRGSRSATRCPSSPIAACPPARCASLGQLFDDPQVTANGLVQTVEQPGVGAVRLLGSLFKVDGVPTATGRPAPALDEHADELTGAPEPR